MTNIKALDKDSYAIEIAADGIGSPSDPYISHHKVVQSVLPTGAAIEARQIQQIDKINDLLTRLSSLQAKIQDLINITGTVAVNNFPVQLDTINVNNFPVAQTVNGNVNVSNLPATQSITDSQVSYTETLFPLNASGTFTGSNRDAQNKNSVRGWVWTNTSGTLYVDQSINSTTWRQTDTIVINGNTLEASFYTFRLISRYYRLRYVNGNNKQTNFEIISTVFGVGL